MTSDNEQDGSGWSISDFLMASAAVGFLLWGLGSVLGMELVEARLGVFVVLGIIPVGLYKLIT